jgi:hypothetical protein
MSKAMATGVTLAAALGVAAAAQAQVAAGGGGRALDANPQAGGARVNAIDPNQTIDYAARNNLITGNVAGGRGFRGQVPYSAPGEFGFDRNATSANSLFDFSARALPSAPQIQAATSIGSVSDANFGVYDTYHAVNTGRVGQSVTYDPSAAALGEVVRFRSAGSFDTQPSSRLVGFTRDVDGGLSRVSISPLLGLRQTSVAQFELPSVIDAPGGSLGDTDDDAPPTGQGQIDGSFVPQSRDADGATVPGRPGEQRRGGLDDDRTGVNALDRMDRRLGYFTGQSPMAADETARLGRQTGSPLGLMIGRQLRRQYDPTVSAAGVSAERIALESARLAETQGQASATPDPDAELSPYDRLMQAARDRVSDPTDRRRGADRDRDPGDDLAADLPDALEGPSDDRLSDAEASWRDAIDRQMDPDADSPLDRDLTEDMMAGTGVQDVLDLLDYDLPAVASLAGAEGDRARTSLEAAEAAMAQGNYVEAERQYGRAQQLRADDPLVRVGMVNAQLGAGMYRSAAFNLRRVFADHPELIAARYAARLLPQQRRLEQVSTELQRLTATPRSASDAGVLLAYLGYQTDSPTLIRFGLAVAEANDTRQDLTPLLRRIWLEQEPDDAEPDDDADGDDLAPSSATP